MKNWNLRQIYLYLVSFVSLMILIVGLINTVQAFLDFFAPETYYGPSPSDVYFRYKSQTEIPQDVIEKQIQWEKEQAKLNSYSTRYHALKRGVSNIAVALPIWLYHWRKIQTEHKALEASSKQVSKETAQA